MIAVFGRFVGRSGTRKVLQMMTTLQTVDTEAILFLKSSSGML